MGTSSSSSALPHARVEPSAESAPIEPCQTRSVQPLKRSPGEKYTLENEGHALVPSATEVSASLGLSASSTASKTPGMDKCVIFRRAPAKAAVTNAKPTAPKDVAHHWPGPAPQVPTLKQQDNQLPSNSQLDYSADVSPRNEDVTDTDQESSSGGLQHTTPSRSLEFGDSPRHANQTVTSVKVSGIRTLQKQGFELKGDHIGTSRPSRCWQNVAPRVYNPKQPNREAFEVDRLASSHRLNVLRRGPHNSAASREALHEPQVDSDQLPSESMFYEEPTPSKSTWKDRREFRRRVQEERSSWGDAPRCGPRPAWAS